MKYVKWSLYYLIFMVLYIYEAGDVAISTSMAEMSMGAFIDSQKTTVYMIFMYLINILPFIYVMIGIEEKFSTLKVYYCTRTGYAKYYRDKNIAMLKESAVLLAIRQIICTLVLFPEKNGFALWVIVSSQTAFYLLAVLLILPVINLLHQFAVPNIHVVFSLCMIGVIILQFLGLMFPDAGYFISIMPDFIRGNVLYLILVRVCAVMLFAVINRYITKAKGMEIM